MKHKNTQELIDNHSPEVISKRLKNKPKQSVLSDAVLGGIDGCVTTFAVVTGAIGAHFPSSVALILGLANLIADAVSMAISNYESIKAQEDFNNNIRRIESEHIEKVPFGEREEIRQIYMQKGFKGDVLEQIVATITSDKELWIDTMLTEEYGLQKINQSPIKSAASTFTAFIIVGMMPLIPFLIPGLQQNNQFIISTCIAGLMFFLIGSLKSIFLNQPIFRAGLSTLLTGGTAAGMAYIVGYTLREIIGIGAF
jgi:vacuolar iron transporter family protein